METFGDEIKVQQGEDWNLDLLLSANQVEYIPYIVSSQREEGERKAFFVITVASTKFEKNLRYVCSFWCALKAGSTSQPYVQSTSETDLPTFIQTTPFVPSNGKVLSYASLGDLPSMIGSINPEEGPNSRYLYQYVYDNDPIDPETGHKPYHYFYYDYEVEGGVTVPKLIKDQVDGEGNVIRPAYECRIRFNFLSEVTANWTGQNYMYQITLVSGQGLKERLEAILDQYGGRDAYPDFPEFDEEDQDASLAAQYKYVKIQWPNELQPDIDDTSPLGTIETPEVILQPTKLQVFNNLRKLI